MGRALAYTRVSTTEQVQHGLGLAVQQQAVVDHCRREDVELVESFEDPGVSGTLPLHERPGLAAALAMVKEREQDPLPITALVVARWDRLARDTLEALLIEREFKRHGVQVLAADGTPVDRTMVEFMHVLASRKGLRSGARALAGCPCSHWSSICPCALSFLRAALPGWREAPRSSLRRLASLDLHEPLLGVPQRAVSIGEVLAEDVLRSPAGRRARLRSRRRGGSAHGAGRSTSRPRR